MQSGRHWRKEKNSRTKQRSWGPWSETKCFQRHVGCVRWTLNYVQILNALTHGLGVAFAIVAFPIMLVRAQSCSNINILAISVYLVALLAMFTSSTLYHSFYCLEEAMKFFRILDKSAIYFLITGTYTPLLVLLFPDKKLYSIGLVGILWTLTAMGVTIEAFYHGKRKECIGLTLYIAMGWSAIIVVYELYVELGVEGFMWLCAGGIAYMCGIPFFVVQDPEWMHVIWHVWVNIGAFLHFVMIYEYVIPQADHC
eukprot:TRINITY_DN12093_c0_g1_i4.p1 TRINITY_DN12093_c0_g1~~TRINITY_DN12093_c0_g1_i4.p1  ORF type:complete len:254 (-),score=35.62 TRINITY_DN12093_c0_g1_i4:116-877(-)